MNTEDKDTEDVRMQKTSGCRRHHDAEDIRIQAVKDIRMQAVKDSAGGRDKQMSIERVRAFFRGYGMEDRIMEFTVSSATVDLAAMAVGCEPCRIAKTLSFLVDGAAVLIVASGDAKVNNGKFKAVFHTKAKMLSHEEAAELIGHQVGGVCPFAVNAGVRVFLDESLKRFETVFPACGSSNSAIELTIGELEKYSGAEGWVDVCKLPE